MVETLSLQTLGVVLGHVQFKELVENLAKKLEEEEAVTIGDTLGNVEAEAMIEKNLADRLAKVEVEALANKLADFKA